MIRIAATTLASDSAITTAAFKGPKRNNLTIINNVQTACIVKGEAEISPLFWRFSGGGFSEGVAKQDPLHLESGTSGN